MSSISKLSVIVPCCNEEGNVSRFKLELIEYLKAFPFASEFIFVDDGSTDRTVEQLHSLAINETSIRVLHHKINKGLGAALQTGFSAATGDVILTLDADLTFHPRQIPLLVTLYQPGVDCVNGSAVKGQFEGVSFTRRLLSSLVNRMYSRLLGKNITGTSSIFRLYRTETLNSLDLENTGFDINAEIIFKMILRGASILEIPVKLTTREFGESKIKTFREIKNHLRLFFQIILWRSQNWVSFLKKK